MKTSAEKTVKVFLSILIGVPLSFLVGQPNTITIPVTAILVVGTGLGTSWRGAKTYCLRRYAVQLVGAALLVGPVLLAQKVLLLNSELTIFLAAILPLSVALIIDYRFMISPMYITSMSVSGLIIIIGTVANPHFILIRLMLVLLGCVLGLFVSCILFPRDYCNAALREIARTLASLLDQLQGLMDGAPRGCDEKAARAGIAGSLSDVSAYRDEAARRRYRRRSAARTDPDTLALLHESQQPLLRLVVNWGARREQLSANFAADYCTALRHVSSAHSALLGAQDINSIPLALELPPLPPPDCAAETVLAALLIEYYEAVENIARVRGR